MNIIVDSVGVGVGWRVGTGDGCVGILVGLGVGTRVGFPVGNRVGSRDGVSVGMPVGGHVVAMIKYNEYASFIFAESYKRMRYLLPTESEVDTFQVYFPTVV